MSEKDFLTGCLSKETVNPTLDKIKAECKISDMPLSILIIDLDRFKTYNDKYGHIAGDEVLKYFADMLRFSLRDDGAFVFRFGGDEFLIAIPRKSAIEARLITNNVMGNLKRRPFLSEARTFKLSFSAGIASYPSDGNEIEAIIHKADKAMYFSKTYGRGKVTLYSHMLKTRLGKALFVFISILFIAGALFYLKDSSYKDSIMDWMKKGMDTASTTLTPAPAKVNVRNLDLVYLKSGRILKGIIMREDKDNIELNLGFETGSGSVTIRRSDIEKIGK